MTTPSTEVVRTIHWFRKGLRLHDNPALLEALRRSPAVPSSSSSSSSSHVEDITRCDEQVECFPIFIIDPHFASPATVGILRYNFLLESLADLDNSLRALGSRLFVVRGRPETVFPRLFQKWGITKLTFEGDAEPYARIRDAKVIDLAKEHGVRTHVEWTHTLHPLPAYENLKTQLPGTYQAFLSLFHRKLGMPALPVPAPTAITTPTAFHRNAEDDSSERGQDDGEDFSVPTLKEMGYVRAQKPFASPDGDEEGDEEADSSDDGMIGEGEEVTCPFRGGETEALARMRTTCTDRASWVWQFEKPKTKPNSLEADTTVLSPYLKFGCLSPRTFFHELSRILSLSNSRVSQPPVSLVGQLLWREFYYVSGHFTPKFDAMHDNPRCRQIPWERDEKVIAAWKHGRTGYPFIDAIMTQLRTEGWIHHLARHATACFLTRGDLWQHWEEGAKVFDLYLLDADWALNNGNWQWLSCSCFFYQYFRIYSPIGFGKKTDPNGDFIRKYIPQLANFPKKFIYEPWKAPLSVQRMHGCVIGKDYPKRIVIHEDVTKENMAKMKAAYAASPKFQPLEMKPMRDTSADNEGTLPIPKKKGTKTATQQSKGKKTSSASPTPPPNPRKRAKSKKT